jgi:hypothetical protein
MNSPRREPLPGEGWVAFASVMFFVLGVFNILDGAVALANDDKFNADELFIANLTVWGLVMIGIGIAQIYTSVALYKDQTSGLVLGIGLATLNLIAHLLFLPAYPIWSILIMTLDLLVIYGLTVYGSHFRGEASRSN